MGIVKTPQLNLSAFFGRSGRDRKNTLIIISLFDLDLDLFFTCLV